MIIIFISIIIRKRDGPPKTYARNTLQRHFTCVLLYAVCFVSCKFKVDVLCVFGR